MQRGILEGRCNANCVCMLLATTPILSDTSGQDSYHYKEDLFETQWNDHLKEQCVKDKERGNSISPQSITKMNLIQNMQLK